MNKKKNFPESWVVEKTGQVGELVHGHQFRSDDFCDEDGIPVLKIGSITNRGVELSESDDIPLSKLEKYEEYKIEDNTPLIALSGATWGKTAYFDSYEKPVLQNYRVGKVTTDDLLNSVFTYQYLSSQNYQDQLKGFVSRQAQENIGKSDFELTEIPVPPIQEQRRIASVLYSVDEQLRTLTDRHDRLSELKHGLMQDLLTGNTRVTPEMTVRDEITDKPSTVNNKELVCRKLKEITDEIYYGDGKLQDDFVENGTYPVYGANGIIGYTNEINNTDEVTTVTCRGATCGNVHYIDEECWITNNSIIVESDESINERYLSYYLSNMDMTPYTSGSAQSQITVSLIDKSEVRIPPLWEQERIASILYTVDEMIARTSDLIDEYERLKRGLMQDLLSGDVRTPENLDVLGTVMGIAEN